MAHLPENISDATLRLLLASGIGPVTLRKLRERFGSDELAARATITELADLHGIGRQTATAIRKAIDETQPDQERVAMGQAGTRLILHGDDDYPVLLGAISDPPSALWIRGDMKEEDRLAISIVGSRNCTTYGREQADRFATLLAESGLTIVSGGALGIDGEAHRGALRAGGRTLVVMGCGLAHAYPPEHESLFQKVIDGHGAIVSEYPMLIEPLAQNFPRRNRIISGLSLGVLVVEAARRSGALITARVAADDHGREVMALPGRVDSPASAGCHQLLQDGAAALVVNHADVLRQLDASSHLVRGALEVAGHEGAKDGATLFDGNLTPGQLAIVEALRDAGRAMLVDQLAARTQAPVNQLLADLTLLEIRGRISKDRSGVSLKG